MLNGASQVKSNSIPHAGYINILIRCITKSSLSLIIPPFISVKPIISAEVNQHFSLSDMNTLYLERFFITII